MTTKFSRHHPRFNRSLALRAFNKFETEINAHFWSYKVVSEFSNKLARDQKKIDPTSSTAELFRASGPDILRIPNTVEKWLKAHSDMENWLRLSALVSACSYFELYLGQVVRSALMSDPLCRFGASKALDGTKLLKAQKELPYGKDIESITKAQWGSRSSAFAALFGKTTIFDDKISELENIRVLRNKFAHGFGRNTDTAGPSDFSFAPADRISQENLLRKLGLLSKTAAEIDLHLLKGFIGSFELVHFYHEWRQRQAQPSSKSKKTVAALKFAFLEEGKCSLGMGFCADLIEYYDAV